MIKVVHEFRIHAGGTKFYETVFLKPENGGRSVLIKRYGPIAKKNGGGKFLIEDFPSAVNAGQARDTIIGQKSKKGEYDKVVILNHGFGLYEGRVAEYEDWNKLRDDLAGHYPDGDKPGTTTATTILGFLDLKEPGYKVDAGPPLPEWKPAQTEDFGSW